MGAVNETTDATFNKDVLEADGVTDFSGYAAIPGTPDSALFPDIFLD